MSFPSIDHIHISPTLVSLILYQRYPPPHLTTFREKILLFILQIRNPYSTSNSLLKISSFLLVRSRSLRCSENKFIDSRNNFLRKFFVNVANYRHQWVQNYKNANSRKIVYCFNTESHIWMHFCNFISIEKKNSSLVCPLLSWHNYGLSFPQMVI